MLTIKTIVQKDTVTMWLIAALIIHCIYRDKELTTIFRIYEYKHQSITRFNDVKVHVMRLNSKHMMHMPHELSRNFKSDLPIISSCDKNVPKVLRITIEAKKQCHYSATPQSVAMC